MLISLFPFLRGILGWFIIGSDLSLTRLGILEEIEIKAVIGRDSVRNF